MKKKGMSMVLLMVIALPTMLDAAGLIFGSRESGFVVNGSTTLSIDNTVSMPVGGRIKVQSGSVSTSGLSCTDLTLATRNGTLLKDMTFDGTVSLGGTNTLTLGNSQLLSVQGGNVIPAVTASGSYGSGTPSVIEGYGQFQSDITISNGAQLNLRWHGSLDVNIALSSSGSTTALVLENDLRFSPGYSVTASSGFGASNIIDFSQGYAIYMGGTMTTPLSLTQSQTWNTPKVHLTGPVSIAASKTITYSSGTSGAIYGHGHILSFSSSSAFSTPAAQNLLFEDITLDNVQSSSFSLTAGSYVYLKDVVWIDSSGNGIRVDQSPTSTSSTPAQLTLASSSAGNLFGTNVTWNNGALIELLGDVALTGTWTFSDNTVIEGHGCALTISGGAFTIANGKTLTLRNIFLKNVASTSIVDPGSGHGTINLCNVTMTLNGASIDWSSTGSNLATTISVNGPTTIVTGSYTFIPPSANASSINGVTLYYNTLSNVDASNVTGFTLNSNATITWSNAGLFCDTGDITYTASAVLSHYQFLSPASGGSAGHRLIFNNASGTIVLDGEGKGIEFPATSSAMGSQVCMQVNASTTATMTNVLFDGYKPAHVSILGSGGTLGALNFGTGAHIRLRSDLVGADALAQTLKFGSSGSATGETMVLDCNGMTIDMASASAAITLQAGGSSGSILKIRNGRLINLSGTKLSAPAGATIYLENMILELSGNYTFASAALEINGTCEVRGVSGSTFNFTSTDNLTIDTDAHFRFADGITYSHNNTGTTNLVLTDGSSSMEFIGATLTGSSTAEGPLVLTKGILLADHNSTINPSTAGIQIGDGASSSNNLKVRLRPGAMLAVATGTLTYENVGG